MARIASLEIRRSSVLCADKGSEKPRLGAGWCHKENSAASTEGNETRDPQTHVNREKKFNAAETRVQAVNIAASDSSSFFLHMRRCQKKMRATRHPLLLRFFDARGKKAVQLLRNDYDQK